MNNLLEHIKELPEDDFPTTLHKRIMRRIAMYQLRLPFFSIFVLLLINLVISGLHAWEKIMDSESISIIAGMLDGFEASRDFATYFFENVAESLPIASVTIFFINLSLLVFISLLFIKLKNQLSENRSNHI